MCFKYSEDQGYELHPKKSLVCQLVGRAREDFQWILGDKEITVDDSFTHLGLTWSRFKVYPDLDSHISSARRTSYLLLGAGLHGINGLDPLLSLQLVSLYVMPRLIYGLEATMLTISDMQKIEDYYRKLLRQIQGLPENTAIEQYTYYLGPFPLKVLSIKECSPCWDESLAFPPVIN